MILTGIDLPTLKVIDTSDNGIVFEGNEEECRIYFSELLNDTKKAIWALDYGKTKTGRKVIGANGITNKSTFKTLRIV